MRMWLWAYYMSTLELERARCVESEACDQTVTLRYRVSLEGFVNVAQLQHSREAHWASFSPPAVRACVCGGRGEFCVWLQAPLTVYISSMAGSPITVCSCGVCMCVWVLYVKAVWLLQGCSSWSLSLHNRGLEPSIWPAVCVHAHICMGYLLLLWCWKSYRIIVSPFISRAKHRLLEPLLLCSFSLYSYYFSLFFSSCILHQ